MKRGLVWALGIILLLGLSSSAMALPLELDLQLDVTTEHIDIDKCIYLGVKQLASVEKSAEASVKKFDWNQNNEVKEIPGVIDPQLEQNQPVTPTALIHDGVFDGFDGIISINQSPGEINNQGNAVSTAFADCGNAFLHAQAKAEQINGEKVILVPVVTTDGIISVEVIPVVVGEGNTVTAEFTPRTNTITDCLIGVHGVVGINQSAGNINNQNNAVAMAVSDNAVACLAESDLVMISGGNKVCQTAVIKTDTLEGNIFSGSGSSGIVGINQATGNICNQSNVISSCLLAPFSNDH